MAEHSEELTGPDLSQGIEITGVKPGELIAGHAFGEPVLLVHAAPNWFAVGGKCTHYGANLAEGVLVGETIRCPWHHACFDLRNGAASCAPALNDLPSYSVSVDNNTVRITGKRGQARLRTDGAASRGWKAPESVVLDENPTAGPSSVFIVGASAAGIACAEMLRRGSYRGRITLVDRDPDAPYDRPNLSKDYLAGNAPEEWLALHPREFFDDQKITILSGLEAQGIDTHSRRVQLSDGSVHGYGVLLIATGASPIRLAINGGERIRYLRTLADCRGIISSTAGARRAVVIGASFIGLEVAASLVTRGLEVHVVAPEPLPLGRVLGTELGELIRNVHQERGVLFHFGRTVKALESETVIFDDDTRLDADVVIAGVGVRPNLELAEKAGLRLDNGIAVNEFLETSADNVFAAGDVARWPDAYSEAHLRVEHWVVAERQGQVVARNMLGHRDRFNDIPFFWSAHYDKLSIRYTGHVEHWDETRIDGDVTQLDCAVSYLVGGKRRAMATINRDRQSLETEVEMERELLHKPSPPVTAEPSAP
jgi:NADPH-dependent 2,4-dienoyl-CoA reductase/sulfur reductase-like enzyme/nitrite reductase/ring-hydroxylating ferredoxin subunit